MVNNSTPQSVQLTEVTDYNRTHVQLVKAVSFPMGWEENCRVSDLELGKITVYVVPKVVVAQALHITFEDVSFLIRCMLPMFWETLSPSVWMWRKWKWHFCWTYPLCRLQTCIKWTQCWVWGSCGMVIVEQMPHFWWLAGILMQSLI